MATDKSPDGAKIARNLTGPGDRAAKRAEEQGGVFGTATKSLAGAAYKGGQSLAVQAWAAGRAQNGWRAGGRNGPAFPCARLLNDWRW